jgi:hypothetical protein
MVEEDVSDDRLQQMQVSLTQMLQTGGDGFANDMILKQELAQIVSEVIRGRDKPLHCPNCDGDHL